MDEKQNVYLFVHHFPTHSQEWEIRETSYLDLGDVLNSKYFFVGRDEKVYMVSSRFYVTKDQCLKSIDRAIETDSTWFNHEVIDLT